MDFCSCSIFIVKINGNAVENWLNAVTFGQKVRYEEWMLVCTKATLSHATDFIFKERKLIMTPIGSAVSDLVLKFLRCQN